MRLSVISGRLMGAFMEPSNAAGIAPHEIEAATAPIKRSEALHLSSGSYLFTMVRNAGFRLFSTSCKLNNPSIDNDLS